MEFGTTAVQRQLRKRMKSRERLHLMKSLVTPQGVLSNDALFRMCFIEGSIDMVLGKLLEEREITRQS